MHVPHAILYISLPSWHDYDMKLPIFTRPFYEVGEQNTKSFFLLFLNSDTVLSNSIQKISPTFDKINEIEYKIDEVWNSANLLFFQWIFGLLSSQNFATTTAWRNDFLSNNNNNNNDNNNSLNTIKG